MSMIKSFLTFSSFTLISRILGFIRDATISALLGTSYMADAFFVAFRLPNLFRMLFAEGAMSAAFVPLYTEKYNNNPEEASRFINETFSAILLILLAISLLAYPFMPQIIKILAPGFISNHCKSLLTIKLGRIMFPYVIFITLVATVGAGLQTRKKFAAMALMPIIPNILFIISPTLLNGKLDVPEALSFSFLIAGLIQLLFMLIAAHKQGLKIKLKLPTAHADNIALLHRIAPTIIGACVTRINVMISTFFASMGAGSVSYIYYADRLQQMPTALIGIAMSYILLPNISQKIACAETEKINPMVNAALSASIILCIPAMIAFFIISKEIVITVFGRGKFTIIDTEQTATILRIFAAGLPAVILTNIIVPIFFAYGDTKTPVKISFWCLLLNLCGNMTLGIKMKHYGVAISISSAAWLNFIMLILQVKKKKYLIIDQKIQKIINNTLLCGTIMGVSLLVMSIISHKSFTMETPSLLRLLSLVSICCLSAIIYYLSLWITKTINVKEFLQSIA
ncbi:putative lipid II flippase MurJ [Candidatus Xenohaliotis californiensis]|uniref:Probable lipid II flippase MurJ n=1 Tax=Candidatus Xenohaliotis californiensis TaxID=84677 RepID=A0ABM9N7C5_9RICK|nr:putative lipid II flippase MurJ [Candidatus Xenohaliotis californiensis]